MILIVNMMNIFGIDSGISSYLNWSKFSTIMNLNELIYRDLFFSDAPQYNLNTFFSIEIQNISIK